MKLHQVFLYGIPLLCLSVVDVSAETSATANVNEGHNLRQRLALVCAHRDKLPPEAQDACNDIETESTPQPNSRADLEEGRRGSSAHQTRLARAASAKASEAKAASEKDHDRADHGHHAHETYDHTKGPCYKPEEFGLAWRNSSTWCKNKINGGKNSISITKGDLEFGTKLYSKEPYPTGGKDVTKQQVYIVWMAGIIKQKADYEYHVCGCRQAVWKGKRRAQVYTNGQFMQCPAQATMVNGVEMGPDVLGNNWCPVGLPWTTSSVIAGVYHNVHKWSTNPGKAPWMINFFG